MLFIYFLPLDLVDPLVGGTRLMVIPGPVFMVGAAPPRGTVTLGRPRPRVGGGARPRVDPADLMSILAILEIFGITMVCDSLILFKVVKNLLSTSRYHPPGGGLMVPLS